MEKELFEAVTLQNFCNIFRKRFRWSYGDIAAALYCDEKTLRRWRKEQSYQSLRDENYGSLFSALENQCQRCGDSVEDVLVSYFSLPREYRRKSAGELKALVASALDSRMQGADMAESLPEETEETALRSKDFIRECLASGRDIQTISMAFYAGWEWMKNPEKEALLEQITSRGITLRVLVNHEAAIGKIASAMADPEMEKFYMGFDASVRQWAQCARGMETMELRVSDYPILRRFYGVTYADGTHDAMARDYAYGFSTDRNCGSFRLTDRDALLPIYCREYEFLWEHGKTYDQWQQTLPGPEEQFPQGDYVLLYLSHRKKDDTPTAAADSFVISALTAGKENRIQLDVNIADRLTPELTEGPPEYRYEGSASVTRNNIFMTLLDQNQLERLTLSLMRPLRDQDRYLGIMTGLSPQAQPVAFKCALVSRRILKELDAEQLRQVLERDNENWGQSLMITEEGEISRFYSSALLTR